MDDVPVLHFQPDYLFRRIRKIQEARNEVTAAAGRLKDPRPSRSDRFESLEYIGHQFRRSLKIAEVTGHMNPTRVLVIVPALLSSAGAGSC